MLNTLIVSGDQNHLEILSSNIRRSTEDSMCIVTISDFLEAVTCVEKQTIIFDLFIINIQLKEKSGFMLEKKIREFKVYKHTPILFLSQTSYETIGYETLTTFLAYKHRNYISLPLNPIDIQAKFCLYLDSIYKNQFDISNKKKILCFKTSSGTIDIPINSIYYLEIQNKICSIYSSFGKFLIKRTSLSHIINSINSPSVVRCHRYYAVNVNKISYIERKNSRNWLAHFTNSSLACPISNTFRKNIHQSFSI